MQTATFDSRLSAVMARDQAADGSFVYAVRSTGIYCRPSCASRRPKQARIALFDSPEQARRAGFRACKRCRPETSAPESDLALQVCRFIDSRPDQTPSLAELARRFGFSAHHLARSFKAAVGMTPKEYASLSRVERLKHRLRSGDSVTDALYNAGYGSSSRLYERGGTLLGMTPNDYRRSGSGTTILFTVVESRLGRLLVASSGRGICAVKLGNEDARLIRELEREFSAAEVTRDDASLQPAVAQIVANIERGEGLGRLPIDVRSTAFTRKVWKALCEIPYGETRTYAQIAAAIGQPGAARAVGRACATNQVALVIPCHRVVPGSGGSGGYRWGPARKRALLERERDVAARRGRETG